MIILAILDMNVTIKYISEWLCYTGLNDAGDNLKQKLYIIIVFHHWVAETIELFGTGPSTNIDVLSPWMMPLLAYIAKYSHPGMTFDLPD